MQRVDRLKTMDIFTQVQSSLEPYIRSRQEISRIRRVLACQLDAQLDQSPGGPRNVCLSLPNDSTTLKHSTANVRGLRKEFLRSLRANMKARRVYDALASSVGPLNSEPISQRAGVSGSHQGLVMSVPESTSHLDGFLALVKQRQRYERVCILRDYIDELSHKAAASSSFLVEAVQSGSSSLPRVPEDVFIAGDARTQKSTQTNLKYLLHDLEKSVLQAKISTKGDKHALNQVKTSLRRRPGPGFDAASKKADALEALGRTRNELIAWVEQELSRAGDSDLHGAETGLPSSPDFAHLIDEQLGQVRSKYNQYVKARQAFLASIADKLDSEISAGLTSETDNGEVERTEALGPAMRVLSPYLEELILVSNEQKALVQQRSHLTVSLSKQHKEAVQLFDRLAEESHLLPSFPKPTSKMSQKSRQLHPLSNEISGAELASTVHRALEWTYAAGSAATTTMEAVLASAEEGGLATDGARRAVFDLKMLLGGDDESGDTEEDDIWISTESNPKEKQVQLMAVSKSVSHDIWASLDGQLGVIKREDHDSI